MVCTRRSSHGAGVTCDTVLKSHSWNQQKIVDLYANVIRNHFCCIWGVCAFDVMSHKDFLLVLQSRPIVAKKIWYFINFPAYLKLNSCFDGPNLCHFIYYPNNNFFSIRQAGSVCFFVSVGILGILSSTLFTPLQSTIITAQHFLSTTRFCVLVKSGIIESQWFIYIPATLFYELFIIPLLPIYADYDL